MKKTCEECRHYDAAMSECRLIEPYDDWLSEHAQKFVWPDDEACWKFEKEATK